MPKVPSASYIQAQLHGVKQEHLDEQDIPLSYSEYADVAYPSTDRSKRQILVACTFEPNEKQKPKIKARVKAKDRGKGKVIIKSGIRIDECCVGAGMWDEGRRVFVHEEMEDVRTVMFSFKFHGYEHIQWNMQVPTVTEGGEPLTRRQLAYLLGMNIKDFVARCSSGEFKSTDPDWSLGDNGRYPLDKILLESAYSRDGVNWLVSLRVLVKPDLSSLKRLILRDEE